MVIDDGTFRRAFYQALRKCRDGRMRLNAEPGHRAPLERRGAGRQR